MEVLYYPHTRCLDKEALKIMFLLFDKVNFIDTEAIFVREVINQNDNLHNDIKFFNRIYDLAYNSNLIDYINPITILKEYDEFICNEMIADVRDEKFFNESIKFSTDCFRVLCKRLPPSFKKYFYCGGITFDESISLQSLIKNVNYENMSGYDRNMALSPSGLHRYLPFIDNGRPLKLYKERFYRICGSVPSIDLQAYKLNFTQFCSLRINEAILVSLLRNMPTITDFSIYNYLLNLKIEKSIEKLSNLYGDIFSNQKLDELKSTIVQTNMIYDIFREIINDARFKAMSIEDVINYRNKNKKKFKELWDNTERIALEIELNRYDKVLSQQYIKEKIWEIDDIIRDLKKSIWTDISKIVFRVSAVLVTSLISSAGSGLGGKQTFLLTAANEVIYLSSDGSEKIIDILNRINSKDIISYSYLIEFNKQKIKRNRIKFMKRNQKLLKGYLSIGTLDNESVMLVIYQNKKNSVFYLLPEVPGPIDIMKENSCKRHSLIPPFRAENFENAILYLVNNYKNFNLDRSKINGIGT